MDPVLLGSAIIVSAFVITFASEFLIDAWYDRIENRKYKNLEKAEQIAPEDQDGK